MGKSKEPIRLRKRKTRTGLVSLYLDIYINGQRSYEYLKLYLIPEKNRDDKRKNQETLKLAEAIRAKRVVELQNQEFGFKSPYQEESNFYEYYIAMCKARFNTESMGNWGNWNSCLKHLLRFDPNLKKRKWKDIDRYFVQGFKDYLENEAYAWSEDERDRNKERRLSRNSKLSYFNKLRACCNQAYEERIIQYNPIRGIEGFKPEEGKRMYLTIEEVRRLVNTPCYYPSVKKAFLFSCLTGLRRSDIERLTWGDVYEQGNFVRIIFTQKKTCGLEYLDLAPEAVELMGERKAASEKVFEFFHSPSCTNDCLREWCMKAGIAKHISFHCGRHTFATMMLDLGTDLYTVSKLLGHREIGTTQIYAKVMDKNKQAAVSAIPSILKQTDTEPDQEDK